MLPSLPPTFAQRHQIALEEGPDGVIVHHTDATPLDAVLEVQRLLYPEPFVLRQETADRMDALLQQVYTRGASNMVSDAENALDIEADDLESAIAHVSETLDLLQAEDDAPIINLLNAILAEAIRARASDVHIEPFESQLRVRFRLDGTLHTLMTLRPELAPMLISRVKVMARLDIAEKRVPQDGRATIRLGGRLVDLRVSTMPSSFGERAVLRLLDKSAGLLRLDQLNMPENVLQPLRQLLEQPHGVLLVTGPTGSGKTTTLYAALNHLNAQQRNIMTIEDPVEYHLEGINQTQVNLRAGMTFAKGLRAMLRQDPDVIMVGEIRDRETADIAIQASLTGHLVLSTLHTNTAIGAVTRLRDMGIEPFLLASGLIGVMAQRLVRRLCPHCKRPVEADARLCASLGVESATIYEATGCEKCHHTGYQGRLGLYELIVMDNTLRQLIHDDASEQVLAQQAHRHTPTLEDHGRTRVLAGETTWDEVLRVVRD